MNGGSRIIDIRQAGTISTAEQRQESVAPSLTPPAVDVGADENATDEADIVAPRFRWVVPLLAALVSLSWIGAMLALSWQALPTLDAVAVASFIAALCVPPALVGIALLLGLRTSKAEARRFGSTAAAMRAEARQLEQTVKALGAAIDANRHALADQATILMAIGDGTVARLASIGSSMAEQLRIADDHGKQLTESAKGAQATLDTLLTLLPRAHAETASMTALLDKTGNIAGESAASLDAKLVALAERAREADALAGGAAERLAAHIVKMEVTSETAGNRLELVTGAMSEAVDGLLGRTADAVDEARKGIAAQGDAMLAMLGTNQAALDRASHDSAEALAARIAAIEEVVDRLASRLGEQLATGDAVFSRLDDGVATARDQLDALHAHGVNRTQELAASISALGGSANAMTEALKTGDAMATTAIGTAERLLIALDAAAREIDETMPEALARLDTRIGDSRKVVADAKPELLALVTAAESTHDAIEAIARVIDDQRRTVDTLAATLLETLTSGRMKADALGKIVEDTIGRTHRFSEEAAPRLVDALLRIRDTANTAAERARESLASLIPEAANALENAAGEAMGRASTATVERHIAALGDAAEKAAETAARVSERLTRQMLAIADSTAVVESRIEDARAEREEADRDTYARRVSLLIESLNSASIDITKAFSAEVSDSAWAAYLKGDRGVFTRRAVRLIDIGEAREIARVYDEDTAFRDQVNRYIHDFEAMLRAILAQRDGTPMGVTLLSSDMGKLYVALAQAIERLRT